VYESLHTFLRLGRIRIMVQTGPASVPAQRHRAKCAPLRLRFTQGFAVGVSRNWAVKGSVGSHCGAAFQDQVTFLQLTRLVVRKLLDASKLKADPSARTPSA
jgi:hypothetical protein